MDFPEKEEIKHGVVKEGVSSDHISAFWDITHTMGDIAGVSSKPLNSDGILIMPLLKGNK